MNIRNLLNLRIEAAWLLLGLISLFSGLIYRFYALNWVGVTLTGLAVSIFFIILWYFGQKFNLDIKEVFFRPTPESYQRSKLDMPDRLVLAAYLFFWLSAITILVKAGKVGAIISPWQSVPIQILALYFFSSLLLLYYLIKTQACATCLLTLHYALSFLIIIFVYRLGYGYDFFVHQATLELIDKAGQVLPKSNYYLGQYGIIITLHRLTDISIYWLHLFLVPLTSALLLPSILFSWLDRLGAKFQRNRFVLALLLLVIPYGILTYTTPQNLAYLFLIAALLISWQPRQGDLLIASVLSLSAVIIQPIAGLPALLLVTWRIFEAKKLRHLHWFQIGLLCLATIGLPLAFFRLENIKISSINIVLPDWLPSAWPIFTKQESIGWNVVYLFGLNWYWIILILIVAGFWLRKKSISFSQQQVATTSLACAFLLAHWLTKLMPFGYLIGYERDDYAKRLLVIAIILFLPLIANVLNIGLLSIANSRLVIRNTWLVFIAVSLTCTFYLSYPRVDRFANSRGYSVGEYDILATKWIDQDAKEPYVVLANQQVSAAALHEFGFAHYYNQLFYYPVPTASPLYQVYLKMVYEKPTREKVREAAKLTGVNDVYFVLNKYWYAFPKVMSEAELSADAWKSFGDNDVIVYKYHF